MKREKRLLSTLFFLLASYVASAGEYIQVGFKDYGDIPFATIEGEVEDDNGTTWELYRLTTDHAELQAVFDNYTIVGFWQEYPLAIQFSDPLADQLDRVYSIRIINGSANDLRTEILTLGLSFIDNVFLMNDPVSLTSANPNDYRSAKSNDDFFGYGSARQFLDLINAKGGWEYTRGLPSVAVGIVDYQFANHTDLDAKVLNISAPIAAVGPANSAGHGVAVAGLAAAITDNNLAVSAVGNKVSLRYYNGLNINNAMQAALDGCKVVNCSWMGGWSSSSLPPVTNNYDQSVIDMIYNMGVTVVAAAGNYSTPNGNNYVYPASYNHVISVTGVGCSWPLDAQKYIGLIGATIPTLCYVKDVHERVIGYPHGVPLTCSSSGGFGYKTFEHNDRVDLCAPAYGVEHLTANNGHFSSNDMGADGTSFASPQVAGAAALLYSLNPNLTPDQVEDYLKAGADDIYQLNYNGSYPNAAYAGLLGAGRLNVGKSLELVVLADSACMPRINDIVWSANSSVINNNNYVNYSQIDFSVASSTIPGNSSLEWEFVSGNDVVVKTGANVSISWGTDFSTNVGPYQRKDLFPLEVYVRQKNVSNSSCVSAFYKESGYNNNVSGGIASLTMPYPSDICNGTLDGTVVVDRNNLLDGDIKGKNIYFGGSLFNSSTQISNPNTYVNAAASKEVRLLPGFHATLPYYATAAYPGLCTPNPTNVFNYYNYFHAYISNDCSVTNHYRVANNSASGDENKGNVSNFEGIADNTLLEDKTNDFRLYPNPSDNLIFIEFKVSSPNTSVIEIVDIYGKVVYYDSKHFNKGMQRYELPVGKLVPSIYSLRLTSGEKRIIHKFVKR